MAITRTPIVNDDGSCSTGTVIDNAWKQEFYDQIDAVAAPPMVPYTPVWKAGGVNFIQQDSTMSTGRSVVLAGGLVWFEAKYAFPAGTVIPTTGGWTVSLPYPLSDGLASFRGVAYAADPAYIYPITTHSIGYGVECALMVPTSPLTPVTNLVPFTWGAGHILRIDGLYRKA